MSVSSIDVPAGELAEDDVCSVQVAAEIRFNDYGGQPAEYCDHEAVTVVDGEPRCAAHSDVDEPDWEAMAEARAEARAEADLDRSERSYERWVYGD